MFVGLLIANAVVYRPRSTELRTVSCALARIESELVYLAGHGQDFLRAGDYVPAGNEGGERHFISLLNDELARLGLTLTKIEPSGEEALGGYVRRSYKLHIRGNYNEIVQLLEYLERLDDVVVLKSFDIKSREVMGGSGHQMNLAFDVIGR